MSETFSPLENLKSARRNTWSQNLSNSSLDSSHFLNFPYIGNSTGLVMTSFCRGYLATVPPISPSSSVIYLRFFSMARKEALTPAGPAPTITTSYIPASLREGPPAEEREGMYSQ